jgi:hypothetical protein
MVQFDESRLAEYCRRHGITRLRLFGSAVRGEDSPESDVDLIADFGVPVGYFELIRAEDEFHRVLRPARGSPDRTRDLEVYAG